MWAVLPTERPTGSSSSSSVVSCQSGAGLRVTSHGHTVIRCEGGLMLRCVPRVDHLGHPDGACTFTVAL